MALKAGKMERIIVVKQNLLHRKQYWTGCHLREAGSGGKREKESFFSENPRGFIYFKTNSVQNKGKQAYVS